MAPTASIGWQDIIHVHEPILRSTALHCTAHTVSSKISTMLDGLRDVLYKSSKADLTTKTRPVIERHAGTGGV